MLATTDANNNAEINGLVHKEHPEDSASPVSDVGQVGDPGSIAQVLKVLKDELAVDLYVSQRHTAQQRVEGHQGVVPLQEQNSSLAWSTSNSNNNNINRN